MEHSTTVADSQQETFETDNPSRDVVRAVADAEGVDPTELAPLYSAIDPDALDALFEPRLGRPAARRPTGEIRFSYEGYEVRVTAAGQVSLEST